MEIKNKLLQTLRKSREMKINSVKFNENHERLLEFSEFSDFLFSFLISNPILPKESNKTKQKTFISSRLKRLCLTVKHFRLNRMKRNSSFSLNWSITQSSSM